MRSRLSRDRARADDHDRVAGSRPVSMETGPSRRLPASMSQTNTAPILLPELPERQRRRAPDPGRRRLLRRRNLIRRVALGIVLATAGGVILTRATGWAMRPVMASYHAGQEIR